MYIFTFIPKHFKLSTPPPPKKKMEAKKSHSQCTFKKNVGFQKNDGV